MLQKAFPTSKCTPFYAAEDSVSSFQHARTGGKLGCGSNTTPIEPNPYAPLELFRELLVAMPGPNAYAYKREERALFSEERPPVECSTEAP